MLWIAQRRQKVIGWSRHDDLLVYHPGEAKSTNGVEGGGGDVDASGGRVPGGSGTVMPPPHCPWSTTRCAGTCMIGAAVRIRWGTEFEVGTLPGTAGRVAIAELGQGNIDAALAVMHAVEMVRPSAILFVGIAGALHDDLQIGDVVTTPSVTSWSGCPTAPGSAPSPPSLRGRSCFHQRLAETLGRLVPEALHVLLAQ
jgi:hypothetical protein